MTDLRKFETEAIQEMSRAIARELDDGTGNLAQLKAGLGLFKFRDRSQMFWTVATRGGQWHRFALNAWKPANAPTGLLEGPDELSAWLGGEPRRQMGSARGRGEPAASSALELLQALVKETRLAYDQGQISSAGAEDSLSGFYLLDRDGRFWMPGARSGDWYYFLGRSWSRAAQGPAADSLVDLRENAPRGAGSDGLDERLGAALANFIEYGLGTLPEAVTEPWGPPEGVPELIRECRVCGTADVGGQAGCRVCGTPFDGPIAAASPVRQYAAPTTARSAPMPPAVQAGPVRPQSAAPYALRPGVVPPPVRRAGAPAAPIAPPPAPYIAPPPPRKSTPWLVITAVGCALVVAISACTAVALWAAYAQGYFDMFTIQF